MNQLRKKFSFLIVLLLVGLLTTGSNAALAINFAAQSSDVTGLRFVMIEKSARDENEDGLIDATSVTFGACAEGTNTGTRDTTPVTFENTYFLLDWEILSQGEVLESGVFNSITNQIPWETTHNGSCFGNIFWKNSSATNAVPGSNVEIRGTMKVMHVGAAPQQIATFEDSLVSTMHGGCPNDYVEDEWTWTKLGFMMSAGVGGVALVENRVVILPIDVMFPPPGWRILPGFRDPVFGYGDYFDYDTGIWANLSDEGDWVPPENLISLADMRGCQGVVDFSETIAEGFETNCVLTSEGLMSATSGGCVVEYTVAGPSQAADYQFPKSGARTGFTKTAALITPADGRVKPAPPSGLVGRFSGKKLNVSWGMPITSGNSKLTRFTVEVRNAEAGGKTLGSCAVSASQRKCAIKLKSRSEVFIAVRSQNKQAGLGPWSFPRLNVKP